MADGIDASVHRVKAAAGDSVLDRILAKAQGEQLASLDDAVLAPSQVRDLAIPARLPGRLAARPWKCGYTTIFDGLGGHASSLTRNLALVVRGL